MERREPDLHAVIVALYESGIDPDSRGDFLDQLIDFVGAERGLIGIVEVPCGTVHLAEARGIDSEVLVRFTRDYDSRDPFRHEDDARVEPGSVRHSGSLLDQAKLRATPIYRELLKPAGLADELTVILSVQDDFYTVVSVYRGEEAGPFGAESIAAMEALAPHLVRARRVDVLLTALERRRHLTEGALDQLGTSVMVVGSTHRVEFMNRAAEDLVSEDDGVRVSDGELLLDGSETTKRLRGLVHECLQQAAGVREIAGGIVPVHRASGRRSLRALVTPMARRVDRSLGVSRREDPAALIVVSEPGRAEDSPSRMLGELFDLTAAEARVVWALVRGLTLEAHAEETGVALSTVRWQLKQVFAKTDTRRQAELVALVLRSLGPFKN